jgi:uncharacterized protein
MNEPISIPIEAVRRLSVRRQHLSGELPARATREELLSVVRDLVFVQWDPIEVVAPSHAIALWSRVGAFRLSDLDRLLWKDKRLFKHWAGHFAALALTEDYPLYYSLMKRYPDSLGKSWGAQRTAAKKFLSAHKELAKSILKQLENGPLRLGQFKDHVQSKRSPIAWTASSDVSEMLFHLEMSGKVMVVGQEGNQNIWGLPYEFLPSAERTELPEEELERLAAQKAIRAMGTASSSEINYYFPRGRYQNLKKTLADLREDSVIHPVRIDGHSAREERYVHDLDLNFLDDNDEWLPRLSLLPPFDNLICGRSRTNKIFGFDYNHEMFLPQNKRKFGYYVLLILWGEKFIGRVDPLMDKRNEKLMINSVHAEPGGPTDKEVSTKIAEKIEALAEFLGAKEVVYAGRVPSQWSKSLR